MLISVEGLDGVGKSSVTNHLASSLNMPIAEKPIKKLLYLDDEQSKKITEKIYSCYSSNIQAMYYLMGYLSVLEDAKKNDILMDRGFLSTYYFSYNKENSAFFDMFATNYGVPDLTIVLYASVEKRINRIKNRNISDDDLKKKRLYVDGYDKYFEALTKYNMPYLLINNENLSLEETSSLVLTLLKLVIEKRENLELLKNLFSIENLFLINQYSFREITELISNRINSNVSNNKTKVLRKGSDNNETINY